MRPSYAFATSWADEGITSMNSAHTCVARTCEYKILVRAPYQVICGRKHRAFYAVHTRTIDSARGDQSTITLAFTMIDDALRACLSAFFSVGPRKIPPASVIR